MNDHELNNVNKWLIKQIEEKLDLTTGTLTPMTQLNSIQIDSFDSFELLTEITNKFGIFPDPNIIWKAETINDISKICLEKSNHALA